MFLESEECDAYLTVLFGLLSTYQPSRPCFHFRPFWSINFYALSSSAYCELGFNCQVDICSADVEVRNMSLTRDEEGGLEVKTTPGDSEHSDPPSVYHGEKDGDPENNYDASPPDKEEQVRQITGFKVWKTLCQKRERCR